MEMDMFLTFQRLVLKAGPDWRTPRLQKGAHTNTRLGLFAAVLNRRTTLALVFQ
jgi:hypothetical protein